jgi:serine/threonine protein kinase
LIDIFQDEKYFYIITEKTSEINILQYIRKLDIHNPLKEEAKICEIVHQILIAIYYLHKMGIMHRNIKPDSLVPYIESRSHNESYSSSSINSESNSSSSYSKSSKTDNNNHDSNKFSNIKLIDLSLSKFININEKIKEPYGTVGYTSPEMLLEQSYDFKIDEWSIGIMTYLLLCGKLPFSDEYSEREIARQTIHEKQSFEQPKWEKISKEAKDFVNKLLIKDPKKRMKVKNALVHPWIKKYYPQIVIKRMKNINDNTTCEEGYEFESFSTPIDNINDLI